MDRTMEAALLNETVNKALDIADKQLNIVKKAMGIKPDIPRALKFIKTAAVIYIDIMNFTLMMQYQSDTKLDDPTYQRCVRYIDDLTRLSDEAAQCTEALKTKKFDSILN